MHARVQDRCLFFSLNEQGTAIAVGWLFDSRQAHLSTAACFYLIFDYVYLFFLKIEYKYELNKISQNN